MPHSSQLQAIDRAADAERGAYNQAFAELGLEWYWDERTYRELRACAGDKHCIHAYIEANHPHLLNAYDGGSLATAIDGLRRRLSAAVPH
jgi:hypothetical protein